MKKMIRMAMMAAALFAVVTTTAKAQGGGGGGRGRANPAVILKDSLKVSDAIVAKADSIWKAYQAEQAPLMEAARGGDASAREKMTAARTKATDAIKALLTDAQKAQFDKLMPAGGGRGPSPVSILKDSLKVSDAIVAKADSIYKAYQTETAPLSEAMRGGDASAGPKLQAARTKMTDAIKALLTDEQKAQYDKLMPARGRRGGGL